MLTVRCWFLCAEGFDVYSPACTLDGIVYFFGTSGLHSFEPATGAWEALPSPPDLEATISAPAVAAHKGRVWVMGGTGAPPEQNQTGSFAYEPRGRVWSRGPELPASLAWCAITLLLS